MIRGAIFHGIPWKPAGHGKLVAILPNGTECAVWAAAGRVAFSAGRFGGFVVGSSPERICNQISREAHLGRLA